MTRGATSREVERSYAEVSRAVEDRGVALDPGLTERLAEALDRQPASDSYRQVPDAVRRQVADLERAEGELAGELLLRLLLLHLLRGRAERLEAAALPDVAREGFPEEWARIARHAANTGGTGFHRLDSDAFLKDLAICRARLVPCGPELADLRSGLPRSAVVEGGVLQAVTASALLFFQTRGHTPFIDLHLHRAGRRMFNAPGYEHCYRVVAALLESRPGLKGLVSTCWWLDPAVGEISPELGFFLDPLRHGATLLARKTDPASVRDAVRLSPTRMERFEAGEYTPRNYTLVWPRRALIRWARGPGRPGGGAASGPE